MHQGMFRLDEVHPGIFFSLVKSGVLANIFEIQTAAVFFNPKEQQKAT